MDIFPNLHAGNQTTLDFPPPLANVTLHFPTTADTIVGRATTDTLTNKTLNNPLFNSSGCGIVNGPAAYACVANGNPMGTTLNSLVKLINAPSQATITATTDVGGIVGICVASCGNTGTATIQQGGLTSCIFDGATTAGDYFQNSAITPGNCHDAGALYPIGQVLGRVLSTNGSAGTYSINLFPPEITAPNPVRTICMNGSFAATGANVTTAQIIKTCSFAPGALNAVFKGFRLHGMATITPGGAGPPNSFFYFGIGASSALGAYQTVASESASATPWLVAVDYMCVVVTPGASGVISCMALPQTSGGTATPSVITFGPTVDLTGPIFIGDACSFSAGSVANICSSSFISVEQFN